MAVIGRFRPSRSGGWEGELKGLLLNVPLRFKPNDDRRSPKAPAFRVMHGWAHVGDAWESRTRTVPPRPMLRVVLDDPFLPAPMEAALLPDVSNERAILLWKRQLQTDRKASPEAPRSYCPDPNRGAADESPPCVDEALVEHEFVLVEAQPCPNKNF